MADDTLRIFDAPTRRKYSATTEVVVSAGSGMDGVKRTLEWMMVDAIERGEKIVDLRVVQIRFPEVPEGDHAWEIRFSVEGATYA